jgi:hypothetical protein
MPFTPSHIVAILPLVWWTRLFPVSALAIGSMIPDLPLFFPVVSYWQTHDPTLVFKICLPLGVAAFVLFQVLLKAPLISLCPEFVQDRIKPYTSTGLQISWRYWLCVVAAIVIGAYSHIFWDSFTHADRWGTQTFPALNEQVTILGRQMAVFKILQHLSTILGLVVLGIVVLAVLYRNAPTHLPRHGNAPLLVKLLAGSMVFVVPLICLLYMRQFDYSLLDKIGLTVRLSGAALALLLATYSLGFHLATRYRFVD